MSNADIDFCAPVVLGEFDLLAYSDPNPLGKSVEIRCAVPWSACVYFPIVRHSSSHSK